jgi:hypothetical protein
MVTVHISTEGLERYYLEKIDEPDLTGIEEHLLWCQHCLDRLEAVEAFIKLVRRGLISGDCETPAKL